MKYHPNMSPRTLTTVKDPLLGYPAHWELLRWYKCWRKYPYPSDVIAAIMADDRPAYTHYPCPLDGTHWHIGRGGNKADPRKLAQRAKRSYRKAVRDEIWRDHVVRQAEEKALVAQDA